MVIFRNLQEARAEDIYLFADFSVPRSGNAHGCAAHVALVARQFADGFHGQFSGLMMEVLHGKALDFRRRSYRLVNYDEGLALPLDEAEPLKQLYRLFGLRRSDLRPYVAGKPCVIAVKAVNVDQGADDAVVQL